MTTRSNRNNKKVRNSVIAVLAVLLALISIYSFRSTYYAEHFLPNTKINKVDVSNLTVSEANKKLQEDFSKEAFTITENGKTWQTIPKTELGYKDDFSSDLSSLIEDQNAWAWGKSYVSADEIETIDPVNVDHQKLDATVGAVTDQLNQLNSTRIQTKDATLTKGANGFSITPEVEGNTIDVAAATAQLKKDAASGTSTLALDSFVAKPAVTSTDSKLKQQLDAMNTIANVKATYSINGDTFQIPAETISSWLTYHDGKADLDDTQVQSYVSSLGDKYDTSKVDTKFKSTKRGEVNVPTGTYSWTIQTADEAAALKKAILEGKDFTRSPIVQGSTTADHPLIESTYIEVDLQNQHMWFYKDGKVVMDTDIVSGKPASPTPPGVFYVWNKEKDATLRGKNDDGTDYASPVKYWMPVDWTGVGIHDSDWQPAYGGDLWKTRGSHGCVNTPPETMAKLFDLVDKGTPVVIF